MQKHGCTVLHFSNPADAIEKLSQSAMSAPDVIVSDFEMTEMSGIEFIQQCKKIPHLRDIPTLILTERNYSEFLVTGIEAGADGFASKASINEVILAQIMALTRVANLRKSHNELAAVMRASRYEILFENLCEGVMVIDSSGKILEANRVACKVLGVSPEYLRKENFSDLRWQAIKEDGSQFPADERPSLVTQQTRQSLRDVKMGIMRNEVELRWLSINTSPIFIADQDRPHQVVISFKDISDELALSEARQAMTAASKMALLGEITAGIAHEINNPITIIDQLAEHLKKKINDGSFEPTNFAKKIERLQVNVKRIEKIVRGLRSYSRESAQDPMEPTSVRSIVDDVVEVFRDRFSIALIEFRVHCDVSDSIDCRSSQIFQVIANLLANAIDAVSCLSEKWVSLDVETRDDSMRFIITDSGSGIPDEILKKMSKAFFTTKPAGQGTGLGMSISRTITSEHGGKLFYDSSSPHTRFILELPRCKNLANFEI
jgi:PAS domain S-box-containing protein